MGSAPSSRRTAPPQFGHENITVSPRKSGRARRVVTASRTRCGLATQQDLSMTSRISLLSAALAVGALVALPALAETPSPASNVQASVDAKTDVKRDAHKVTKSKKPHEQTAAKPGS